MREKLRNTLFADNRGAESFDDRDCATMKRHHVAATMTVVAILMRNIRAKFRYACYDSLFRDARVSRFIVARNIRPVSSSRFLSFLSLLLRFFLFPITFLFLPTYWRINSAVARNSHGISRNKLLPEDVSLPTSALAHENEFLSRRRASKRANERDDE